MLINNIINEINYTETPSPLLDLCTYNRVNKFLPQTFFPIFVQPDVVDF